MKQSIIDNPTGAKTSNASPMKDAAVQQKKISSRRNLRFPWLGKRHTLTSWLAKQLEETRPKGAIASLDGVRAIACLIVIAYHISLMARDTRLWTVNGHPITTAVVLSGGAGVTLFFVLSGFLLFLPYAKALLFEQPWQGARLFYLRRVLRIIPGYYFSLVLLVMFSQSQYLQPQRWGQLLLFPLFLMDSSQKTFQQLNGPYWTLAIEWQYYLLLPLIALGIRCVARWIRPEKRFWAIAACLLGVIGWGLFTRSWGDYLIAHPTATVLVPRSILNPLLFVVYGTHGKYLEDFAVGMLAGLVYTTARDPARAGSTGWLYRLSPWLWGTGIPACIIILDKENAASRTGIFMIDASRGFMKDGNKNRLRHQDIHKIVDVFNRQLELPGYSRMVRLSEIIANDYNLNIPPYIDSSEPEDLHDIEAHLLGGIPNRDIEALGDYWQVFPTLKQRLFADGPRPGYSQLCVEVARIKPTIFEHPEFVAYTQAVTDLFEQWKIN